MSRCIGVERSFGFCKRLQLLYRMQVPGSESANSRQFMETRAKRQLDDEEEKFEEKDNISNLKANNIQ